MDRELVTAGIHYAAEIAVKKFFSKDEKRIVNFWANEWYITKAGKRTTSGP